MSNNSPITPPPELRCQWQSESPFRVVSVEREDYMIDRAAQWGADQELEACCQWVSEITPAAADDLRADRRPKPASLKEQAFKALGPEPLPVTAPMGDTILNKNIIERHRLLHRALEALPND